MLSFKEFLTEKTNDYKEYKDRDGNTFLGHFRCLFIEGRNQDTLIDNNGIIKSGKYYGMSLKTLTNASEKTTKNLKKILKKPEVTFELTGKTDYTESELIESVQRAYCNDPINKFSDDFQKLFDSVDDSEDEIAYKLVNLKDNKPHYTEKERKILHNNLFSNKDFTDDEKHGIIVYQTPELFNGINVYLRTGNKNALKERVSSTKKKHFYDKYKNDAELVNERLNAITQIKTALKKTELKEDVTLVRGIDQSALEKCVDKSGNYHDDGIVSLSSNIDTAIDFSAKNGSKNPVILVVNLEHGHHALPMTSVKEDDISDKSGCLSEIITYKIKGKQSKVEFKTDKDGVKYKYVYIDVEKS